MTNWRTIFAWQVAEFAVGDKVVPIKKSIGLVMQSVPSIREMNKLEQPYLVVTRIEVDGTSISGYKPEMGPAVNCWTSLTLSDSMGNAYRAIGDYYLVSDLERYSE